MRFGSLILLVAVLGVDRSSIAEEAKPDVPAAPRFVISKETTYVAGPVRADGTIDYVEAINERLSKGVTKENNAAISLLQAAMAEDPMQARHYAKVCQKLGIAPPEQAKGAELPPNDPAGLDETLKGLWTADKAPQVAEWLKAMDGQLKLLVDASKHDRYYMPLVREQASDPLVSVLLPHLSHQRHLCNALKSRAMLRLGNEEMDGFCDDVIAIVRIGRLTTHAPTLVENLVGTACEASGLDAMKVAATGRWLSEAQVDRLLKELRAAPARRPMYDVFEGGERGFLLEFLQTAAVHGVGEAQKMLGALGQRNAITLAPVDPVAKDWNAAMRKANGWYDQLAEAGKKPSHVERMRACKQFMRDIEALKVKYDGWKAAFAPVEDRMIALVMPSMERAYTDETKIAANLELTETALALSGFRSRTAEYPPELKLLVPAYFKETPVDRFNDHPLTYRLEGNGYVLLSVGPDEVEGGAKGDDLVVEVRK
ncbi:MAG: hypothetical protein JWN40_1668 [Phycisphaerales bacterium]|nr:hypothetical protein [Phycisphaerales bacterium]